MKTRKKRIWSESDIKLNEQSTTLTAEIHSLACPSCESRKYAKSGKHKGNQRYTCSRCGKQFRSTTGNTIHHLHLKPKIQEYIECMNKGLSLRKTATKCDISLQTAFRWRHRFLNAMNKQPLKRLHTNNVLSAIRLPYSCKGKSKRLPVKTTQTITSILQVDIAGTATMHVLNKYGTRVKELISLTQNRTNHLPSQSIPKLLKSESAKCITPKQIQQTQQIHKQIKDWLAHFRGVASKYLANYWKWFIHNRQINLTLSQETLYMHSCF